MCAQFLMARAAACPHPAFGSQASRRPTSIQASLPRRAFASTPQHQQRARLVAVLASEEPSSLGLGLQEAAALDGLIDLLLGATDAQDLSKRVAENIMSFDQRFWLRLATRTDTASSSEEQERLAALARVAMQLVDAMVRKTSEQLSESSDVLQKILRAAADERTGQWELPLPQEKLEALRAAMDANADQLDEALLSNCFAWMRKSADDKLDGMVALLQKVLQVYAGRALSGAANPGQAPASPADTAVQQLLAADEATWAADIRRRAEAGEVSEPSFMEALQRRMESVVLGLSSGSYAQRVQAEYLKELESRAKGVFAELAAEETA